MAKRSLRREPTPLQRHEAAVVAGAEKFVACNFRGCAQYDHAERLTLEEAVEAARSMIAERATTDMVNKGRPVLIYAIKGVHSVVAQLVRP